MKDFYKELKEKDYEAYQKAIQFSFGICYNAKVEDNKQAEVEREIINYTYSLLK